MNECSIRRYALILAVQAEIEGMKAPNQERLCNGQALAYSDEAFKEKAERLRDLAYTHDLQLFGDLVEVK